MSTITREWLHQTIAEYEANRDELPFGLDTNSAIELQAFKLALASLEAEAVAWRCDSGSIANRRVVTVSKVVADSWGEKGMKVSPLYATPPATVSVPAAYEHTEDFSEYHEGWNAFRAAMLQGADERHVVRSEHAEWSQSTFGDVGPVGPLKHLSKEALEAAAEPGDLSEWADMQFLLWDAQRRAGITDEQITLAMIDKLAVNKARNWPEPKDGEPRLHIKAAPQQEVK